jgi:hypothetical protein
VSGATRRDDAWEHGDAGWALAYGIILAATFLIVLIEQPPPLAGRIIAGSALLAMVPWYALVGRSVLDGRRAGTASAVIYLAGLGALFVIAASQTAQSAYILFALSPQCLMVLQFPGGVAAASLFSCLPVSIALLRGRDRAEIIALLGIAVLGVAFSVAFGGFVKRIIDQSRERAELIGQLEAARAELAAADREAGVLAERQRLSSEIHDTIAQGFTSIVMLIQAAEAQIGTDPAQAPAAGGGVSTGEPRRDASPGGRAGAGPARRRNPRRCAAQAHRAGRRSAWHWCRLPDRRLRPDAGHRRGGDAAAGLPGSIVQCAQARQRAAGIGPADLRRRRGPAGDLR